MAVPCTLEHGSIPTLRQGQKPPSPPFHPQTHRNNILAALNQLEQRQRVDGTAVQRLRDQLDVTQHTVSDLSQRVVRLAKTAERARLAALCATGALLGYCRGKGSRKGLLLGAIAGIGAAALWRHFNEAEEEIGSF